MLVHGVRHTFATELANENISVNTLMKLLGHESMVTSQRYVDGAGTEHRVGGAESALRFAQMSGRTMTGATFHQTPAEGAHPDRRVGAGAYAESYARRRSRPEAARVGDGHG